MLAPSLAGLAMGVDAPSAWLSRRLPTAMRRVHPDTPAGLVEALQRAGGPEGPGGWICTRPLDGRADPPLRVGERLEVGAWVCEFAFARPSWRVALLGVGIRRAALWRGLEARARAFLDADLREVEQWTPDGFPEVCVTLGRAGVVAAAAQAARLHA